MIDGVGLYSTAMESNSDTMLRWQIFHDLTEYLLVYHLGHSFITTDADKTSYRMRGRWFAIPEPSIRTSPQTLSDIKGSLAENLFYGTDGGLFGDEWRFDLPKGTQMRLRKDDKNKFGISVLTFEKKRFMRIDIAIEYLVTSSQGHVFPVELPEGVSIEGLEKPYRAAPIFETRIHYDAKFDKWHYSYPEMRHYETWAKDLLALLQRQFSWGNPRLADTVKVHRYYKLREEARQRQLQPKGTTESEIK
ncbi:MAG: hypothetical protein ABFE13_07385 [Phycisphaerales bacterium]